MLHDISVNRHAKSIRFVRASCSINSRTISLVTHSFTLILVIIIRILILSSPILIIFVIIIYHFSFERDAEVIYHLLFIFLKYTSHIHLFCEKRKSELKWRRSILFNWEKCTNNIRKRGSYFEKLSLTVYCWRGQPYCHQLG